MSATPALRRWMCGWLTAALVCAVAIVGAVAAPGAAAHSQLVSSNPADGAVLTTMPNQVEFVFNESINPAFAQVAVVDGSGRTQSVDDVAVSAGTVTAPIPPGVTSGQMEARYRVVSADGHPISGSVKFKVVPRPGQTGSATATSRPGSEVPATDTPGSSPSSAATASAAPSAESTSASTQSEDAETAQGPASGDAPRIGPYLLVGVAALIMVAVGAYLVITDRRSKR